MNQTNSQEYLHSWYLFLVTILTLLYLLINRNLFLNLCAVIVSFTIYFKNGLSLTKFKNIIRYAFFFSFSFFVLSILYSSKELKTGEIYQVLNMVIYKNSLLKGLEVMGRIFLVSLLSMCSSHIINYTKIVLYLIIHKGLKLFVGYPILLAINSIALFQNEFVRIRINAKLRELPWKDQFFIFFPLLVFAIKHSQRGAMSLVTRGLNEQKSFYFSYDLSSFDRYRLRVFFLIYLLLIFFAIY